MNPGGRNGAAPLLTNLVGDLEAISPRVGDQASEALKQAKTPARFGHRLIDEQTFRYLANSPPSLGLNRANGMRWGGTLQLDALLVGQSEPDIPP